MSRSRRKSPYTGIGADSDKEYKAMAHRSLRRAVHMAIARGEDPPDDREFGDIWLSCKDGKWRIDPNSKYMRK